MATPIGLATAQSSRCLASLGASSSERLAYKHRQTRCEGTLPLFVSSSNEIQLLGYMSSDLSIQPAKDKRVSLLVVGGAGADVTLKALSLTSTYRYQMDRIRLKIGEAFEWPLDVAAEAASSKGGSGLDVSTLGVIACSNRCDDHPDTLYWPVTFSDSTKVAAKRMSVLLRSGVRAPHVRLRLVPPGDAPNQEPISVTGPALLPDDVARLHLPETLGPGIYAFTIDARDDRRQALGSFKGKLYIPRMDQ